MYVRLLCYAIKYLWLWLDLTNAPCLTLNVVLSIGWWTKIFDEKTVILFQAQIIMMTSSNGNIIHVTGPTGDRWFPFTKARDTELWRFLWTASEKKNGWANNRDADDLIALWRHCNFCGSVAMNTPQVNLISYKNLLVLRSPPSVVTPPPPHTHTPHTPNIRMHNMALSAKHIFYKKTSAIWKLAIVLASYNKWTW